MLLVAFGATGATALIFEVVAGRYLGIALGATADTAALAVAFTMLGISAGGLAGAWLAPRTRAPLGPFALAQVALAAVGSATPWTVRVAERLVLASPDQWGARALAAALVVMPAGLLMGASLPLVGEAAVRAGAPRGPALARLYAAGTWGGAAGVVVGITLLLPRLGLAGTLYAGAFVDLCVPFFVWLALRAPAPHDPATSDPASSSGDPPASDRQPPASSALVAIALASAILFALEVLWTHVAAAVAGASVHAFAWMLLAVLVGLGVGGRLAANLTDLAGEILPWVFVGLAALIGLTLPLWDRVPLALARAGEIVRSFEGRESVRLALLLLFLVGPTALLGMAFPLAMAALRAGSAGRAAGLATAASALGGAAGATLASAAVPSIGSEAGFRAAGALALGVALLWSRALGRGHPGLMVACALAVAPLALMPRWNPDRIGDGSGVWFKRFQLPSTIHFAEDRAAGVVTVRGAAGLRQLFANGKIQGDAAEMPRAQALMIGYPLLGLTRFERALVIGLGTGYTTRLAASRFARVDVAEVSPAIVHVARTVYADLNAGVLGDPRVALALADGRHVLARPGPAYDLVSIQVSSLWEAGSTGLYARELYARAKARLAPGGAVAQWFPLHHVTELDLARVIATARAELPFVTVWAHGTDGVLVASARPQPLVEAAVLARRKDEAWQPVLRQMPVHDLAPLLGDLVLETGGVEKWLEAVAQRHGAAADDLVLTDERNSLEFSAARALAREDLTPERMMDSFRPYRSRAFPRWRAED